MKLALHNGLQGSDSSGAGCDYFHIPFCVHCQISRYLHFVDNDHLAQRGDPAHDRLGKVRPLIDHLSSKFETLYEPSKKVAVDEAMIKFQGRSSLKQYMPQKPIKRGIKVWVLGDNSNGYFSRLDIYTGRKIVKLALEHTW